VENERFRVHWEDQPRGRKPVVVRRGFSLWTAGLTGLGAIAIVALIVTRPREIGDRFDQIPREVAGRWVTSDPRYADRMLVIERDRVDLLLELGAAGRERHPIDEVRGWDAGGSRGYRIRYGVNHDLVMDVLIAADGTLRLKNPSDVVWRRLPFVY
jgi:hypothetical protein